MEIGIYNAVFVLCKRVFFIYIKNDNTYITN